MPNAEKRPLSVDISVATGHQLQLKNLRTDRPTSGTTLHLDSSSGQTRGTKKKTKKPTLRIFENFFYSAHLAHLPLPQPHKPTTGAKSKEPNFLSHKKQTLNGILGVIMLKEIQVIINDKI